MRIITGKAKGCRLETLDGDATRPTSERAKEAIFSMIQFDIEGRVVLDLFAGSGQLGLEALSRGAKSAVLVDKSADAVKIIKKNAEKTRLLPDCEIITADGRDYIRTHKGKKFDIVLLDPPYSAGLLPETLESLFDGNYLKETSIIVCESRENGDVFGENTGLCEKYDVVKASGYGIVHITLLRPKI